MLAGHGLLFEGRCFEYGYRQKVGPAKSSCGATSPDLGSDALRKRWHPDHKAHLLTGQSS